MTTPKTGSPSPSKFQKSYENVNFLKSAQARLIRVLCEMIEPEARFRQHKIRDTVVMFGSARTLPKEIAQQKLKQVEALAAERRNPSAEIKQQVEDAKSAVKLSRYYDDAVKLAEKITRWSNDLADPCYRFIVCSGGGPGIMEAANRGAHQAGGPTIGLNISLPFEQVPNPYQTRDISFEFHYFFIRKFWFFYMAKALIVFPGGFGTLDEFFELLTIVQTKKSKKYMPIVLYGKDYWNDILDFQAMQRWGVISKEDLDLFRVFDDVDSAFKYLTEELTRLYLKKKA
ncbi:MAG: LOG family protein [Candidatus Omnitrophota bacterium]|nr:LOG family protein [Candidatus Omnitrophota bacterium]MDZ4242080.1 LOG family protein [Candidatus Omnitrophota bacterium]